MAVEGSAEPREQQVKAPDKKALWWCNFCEFRTNIVQEYLSHSCRDVLDKAGVKTRPTGQNECR